LCSDPIAEEAMWTVCGAETMIQSETFQREEGFEVECVNLVSFGVLAVDLM